MTRKNQDLSFYSPLGKIMIFSRERRIPDEVLSEWCEKVKNLDSNSKKEAYAENVMAFMEEHYPIPSKEEFLQEAEETRDWENLRYRIHHYWDDVPSMLPDAVRVGAHQLVAEIAPHCLFDNPELQKEYLALAPDEVTRKALTDQVMINRDDEFEKYPFSCVYNQIHSKFNFKALNCRLISMPVSLQEEVWQRFLKQAIHGSEQEFFRHMYYGEKLARRPEYASDLGRYEYFLFNLGYELTPNGFVRRNLPDYWINSEYGEAWKTKAERIEAGSVGMLCFLRDLGWEVVDDRTINYFGCTGYSYLKEV